MNDLSRKNLKAVIDIPDVIYPDISTRKPHEHLMICTIRSAGCRFKKQGSCIMCDYGQSYNLTPQELHNALYQHVLPNLDGVNILLFGSYGSIFDSSELSDECIDVLFNFLKTIPTQHISFETHYLTITDKVLEKIKNTLPDKNISIELGYESCSKEVLTILNKPIDFNKLNNIIQTIHQYGMSVVLNVLLGIPALTLKQQLDTALDSVIWAFEHDADQVIIFPLTIKPFTYAYKLYEMKKIEPISHWMLIELLHSIPSYLLGMITLSWYDPVDTFYKKGNICSVPPTDCFVCRDLLQTFYRNYVSTWNVTLRKIFILDLIRAEKDLDCNCRNDFLRKLWE